jgi:heat-inducible transcriptional repressor
MNPNRLDKKEERNILVLGHIIREYVANAVPVSSKIIAQVMGGDVSSATIRNIMAELEDKGYIAQPHTSAGRVPTDAGYRKYVDMLRGEIQLQRNEAERLSGEYDQRISTIKGIIERATFLISHELHNAGLAMLPNMQSFYLKRLELVKIKAQTVMAVLVTVTNAVTNYIIKLDRDLDEAELQRISNYVNAKYEHSVVSEISDDLKKLLSGNPEETREFIDTAEAALRIVDAIIEENIENEIYIDGLDYFTEEPEFRDLDLAKRMIHMLSERRDLVSLMRSELPDRGLRIYIGGESEKDMLKSCSLITCGYSLQGRTLGRIGVIGPTRMDYYNALRTVSCLADIISGKLEEIS